MKRRSSSVQCFGHGMFENHFETAIVKLATSSMRRRFCDNFISFLESVTFRRFIFDCFDAQVSLSHQTTFCNWSTECPEYMK